MRDILEVMAGGIRSYCSKVEVQSRGETTPDPVVHSLDYARAVLAALEAKGFAVVPVVPTDEMMAAGEHGPTTMSYGDEDTFYYVSEDTFYYVSKDDAAEIWTAMLAASKPSHSQKEKP